MEPGTLFRVKPYKDGLDRVSLGSLLDDHQLGESEQEVPLDSIGVVIEHHEKESNNFVDAFIVLIDGRQGWLWRDEMEVIL